MSLYSYDPGDGAQRFIDPFAVERGLVLAFAERGQTEENVLNLMQSENPVQRAEGSMHLEAVARKVFELVPFNGRTGEGCSPAQACEVYRKYFEFAVQKKTTSAPTPTSPTATDPLSSPYLKT